MNELAKEYGTALYMLASEENSTEAYFEDLKLLSDTFGSEPDYLAFLTSPNIPLKKRLDSIKTIFDDKVHENIVSFLQLMCEKRRLEYFFEAVTAFEDLLEASKHILTVKVKSAVSLTDLEKERLKNKLEEINKCTVIMEYQIDPELIGGVVLETEDNITDGSIRHRLQQVKEVIGK